MSGTDIPDEWLVRFIRGTVAATFSVTAEGYVVDVPEWTRLTGQTAEQARGAGWMSALHESDAERAKAAWQTAVMHGTNYNTDYRVRCADGIYRWFNARAVPILSTDGEILRWVGAILSIPGSFRFGQQEPIADTFDDISPAALRAARAMLGWSAEKLAEEADISRSTIRRLESDDSNISARRTNIARILRALSNHGLILLGHNGVVMGVTEDYSSPHIRG